MDIDIGVIGEGEAAIVEIVDALIEKSALESIHGLIIKPPHGGPPIRTPERKINRAISALPWPDFEGFGADRLLALQTPQDNSLFHQHNRPRALPIISSRSCPFNCTFCYHPSGKTYRERDLDDFFRELDHLVATYKINTLMVLDELMAFKKSRLEAFCRRIKSYNLPWLCQLHVKVIDASILHLLKEAGCVSISLGIESMSSAVLDSMQKQNTPEQLEKAMDLIYAANICLVGNFIFGDEAETVDTIAETFDYWAKRPEYTLNLSALVVLPGSTLYRKGVQDGRIKDPEAVFKTPNLLVNMTQMPDGMFRAILDRIRFYGATLLYKAEVLTFDHDSEPHPVLGTGGFECRWRCPKCQKINHYRNIYHYGWSMRLTCRHCQARAHIGLWSRALPPHPEADRKILNAERIELLYQRTKNPNGPQQARQLYHEIITTYCKDLHRANDLHYPWACIEAFFKFARYQLDQGDIQGAFHYASSALLHDVWNPEGHALIGRIVAMEGSLGTALLYYNKAIELSDDPPHSWLATRQNLIHAIHEHHLEQDKAALYFNGFKQSIENP